MRWRSGSFGWWSVPRASSVRCRFYGESLAFPRLQSWDREDERAALFQAGSAVIEVLGRPARAEDARLLRRDAMIPRGRTTR